MSSVNEKPLPSGNVRLLGQQPSIGYARHFDRATVALSEGAHLMNRRLKGLKQTSAVLQDQTPETHVPATKRSVHNFGIRPAGLTVLTAETRLPLNKGWNHGEVGQWKIRQQILLRN